MNRKNRKSCFCQCFISVSSTEPKERNTLFYFHRALKKSELQMKVGEDALAHVRSVYDKVKAQVDSAPRDDGTLLEKRKELQREVDVTKRTLAQQVTYITDNF